MLIQIREKFWGGYAQKWVWLLRSHDSKIGSISRINRWNKLIFLDADTNSGKIEVTSITVGWAWSEMGMAF